MSSWQFSSVFTLVVLLLVVVLNGVVFFCFLAHRRLRENPFNVYLMCLLVFNILYAAMQNPLDLADHLYLTWPLGRVGCIVYHYSANFIPDCQMLSHLLITANRVWAVAFPLSYRRMHSHWVAFSLCLLMCVYAHFILLPEYLPQMLNMRTPLQEYGCLSQYYPSLAPEFGINVLAWSVVIGGYPYIVFKQHRRKLRRKTLFPGRKVIGQLPSSVIQDDAQGLGQDGVNKLSGNPQSVDRGSNAFTVLTLLTCSNLVFWTPAVVVFVVNAFKPVPYPDLFEVILTLFALQPVADPILFTVAKKDLQASLRRLFCCQRK